MVKSDREHGGCGGYKGLYAFGWLEINEGSNGLKLLSGRGVTANMPVLGTGDSGFESRRPDNDFNLWHERDGL